MSKYFKEKQESRASKKCTQEMLVFVYQQIKPQRDTSVHGQKDISDKELYPK